jgi:sugar transferase (PEP-CTERM system associated)
VVLELLFIVAAFVLALIYQSKGSSLNMDVVMAGVSRGVLMGISVLSVNFALGIYSRGMQMNLNQIRARFVLSFFFFLAIATGVLLLMPLPYPYGNSQVMLILLAMGGSLLIFQLLVGCDFSFLYPRRRVLIFGAGARARDVGISLKKHDPSIELIGYFLGPQEREILVPQNRIMDEKKSLTEVVSTHRVDEIVVALSERRAGSMPLRELLDCKLGGIQVIDIATHFEQFLGQIRLDAVSAGWLVFGGGFQQGLVRSIVKWIFDFFGSLILLILSAPIMLLTAIMIFIESKGPILYRQERVGLAGKPFNVIKFRSMYVDAEKDGTPRWATAGDPRITRIGKWIRKTRIDELPQLFSVLKGDMSLVGPRPERPFFVEKLTEKIPFYAARHSVKPGLTGWAQVRYHYGSSVEDTEQKLQYDLFYVKNNSWFLDLLILFETVGVVLTGKGAQ